MRRFAKPVMGDNLIRGFKSRPLRLSEPPQGGFFLGLRQISMPLASFAVATNHDPQLSSSRRGESGPTFRPTIPAKRALSRRESDQTPTLSTACQGLGNAAYSPVRSEAVAYLRGKRSHVPCRAERLLPVTTAGGFGSCAGRSAVPFPGPARSSDGDRRRWCRRGRGPLRPSPVHRRYTR